MIRKIPFISFLLCFTFLSLFYVHSQIITKEILTGNNKIFLSWDESDFFRGNLKVVTQSDNKIIFSADSIFTRYNWDTLIDLDNEGTKELILDLGTGATMYDYNMFLIFDFNKNFPEPLEVHNAELIANKDEVPKIVSYVRLSPAALGAGYAFSLKYENGKLFMENDINKSLVLKEIDAEDEGNLHLISEYKKAFDECEENSEIKIFFEAYLMQQKFLGQEKQGWKFFDKNYKCKDKKKVKAMLKKSVKDSYDFWNKSEFKFGGQGNY